MIGQNRRKKGSGIIIEAGANRPLSADIVVGVDAGSTETRVCLADFTDASICVDPERPIGTLETLSHTYIIPSTYASTSDNREILSDSPDIESNYDSTIMTVYSAAEHQMITRSRILRGRKMTDTVGLVYRYLDSSTNKSDNQIFYVNILDSIGYAVMQKYNKAIPLAVNMHIVLSVRPKEMTQQCRKRMIENLVGQFVFAWGNLNINMNILSVDFTTEPEAQVFGTTLMCDLKYAMDHEKNRKYVELADRLSDTSSYIHIEGGGSSIGVEVVRNGQLVDSCSSTFQLGGNYLCQVFIDRVREILGRTATQDAAAEALWTDLLRDGREVIDVNSIVADCKNEVALNIVESLRHNVIDLNNWLSLRDVEFISLGGRLFRVDDRGNSIAEYLKGYIQQVSPNTDVIVLEDNYIPQGNLITAINTAIDNRFFKIDIPNADEGDPGMDVDASSEGSAEGDILFTAEE